MSGIGGRRWRCSNHPPELAGGGAASFEGSPEAAARRAGLTDHAHARGARLEPTRAGYQGKWRRFQDWCAAVGSGHCRRAADPRCGS